MGGPHYFPFHCSFLSYLCMFICFIWVLICCSCNLIFRVHCLWHLSSRSLLLLWLELTPKSAASRCLNLLIYYNLNCSYNTLIFAVLRYRLALSPLNYMHVHTFVFGSHLASQNFTKPASHRQLLLHVAIPDPFCCISSFSSAAAQPARWLWPVRDILGRREAAQLS